MRIIQSSLIINNLGNKIYLNKRSKSLLSLVLVFGFILFIMIFLVSSANLNLRINGTTDGFASNIRLKTNPNAIQGYDIYDLEAPPNPGNLSVFYSSIPGYNLTIDTWNATSNPRTLNLSYLLPITQSGIINFSWASIFGSGFFGYFSYYGNNSTYSSGGNFSNLRINTSYNNILSSYNQVYMQVNISNIQALTVSLNSTDGTNKTLEDLNCFTTLSDPDPGHKMNVTAYWFKNNLANLTLTYNDSYDNATTFNSVLNNLNTTKGENWSCGIQTYDSFEFSAISNSSKLTVLNSIPNITQYSPENNNITTNRTPTFYYNITDDDNDTLAVFFNITLVAHSTCSDPRNIISTSNSNNYTLIPYLKCLTDNLDDYNWSMLATDGESNSSWTVTRNISVQSVMDINLTVFNVNFGSLNPGNIDNTSDGNPPPLIIKNNGNVLTNITANFSNLWNKSEAQNPSKYYQFKVRNVTPVCFDYSGSNTTWANATTTNLTIINKLNFTLGYQAGCDNASIDIAIEVPSQEPPADRSSYIVLMAGMGER